MDKRVDRDTVAFALNGQPVEAAPRVGERLSETLRERLGARDVKVGCDAGDCGACTVLLDGEPVCACLTAAHQAKGRCVETVSGLLTSEALTQKLSDAFAAHGAAQCGICTPGMLVAATALLKETPSPDTAAIEDALGGVLCRCTGYRKIVDAVAAAGADAPLKTDQNGAVGGSIARLDGAAKLDGSEQFGDDVASQDALSIHLVRSPFPHARFELGDVNAWSAQLPDIACVMTAKDVPGKNLFGVIPGFVDQPVFAVDVVRFRGEAIAAIVGTRDAIATLDLDDFPITWTQQPHCEDMTSAMAPGAALLHADRTGNVMCRGFVAHGDPGTALEQADVVAERTFTTAFVEHAYIEPEAGFAEMVDGRVHVHACTQAPVMDLESLQDILGCDQSMIRIVPTATGGGFGAKLDLSVQPYLALAALKTGRPVRIAYSRTDSMQSTTKRHPGEMRVRIGASADGRISGMTFDGLFNTGAYASWGPTVATRVPIHASGPYRIADYRAEATGVHTHCPPSGAFRGFGVPQSAIAQECLFDDLADQLGIDRLDFRLKNALQNGEPTVCGQVFEQGVGIKACLEALKAPWQAERARARAFNEGAKGPLRHGVGIAAGWYGCGNTSLPNPSTIKSGIRADGTVVLHQGATDIGQGANTVIAQIFAEALGVPVATLTLLGGDTDITPDAGKTSASRQTFVSGNAAKASGEALRTKILSLVNAAETSQIEIASGEIRVADGVAHHRIDLAALPLEADDYVLSACETYDPPTDPLDENGQGAPYAQFGYAAHLAVVEVDLDLGTTRVIKMVAAHDVGRAINPLLVEGQVQGGIAQGLGMALMEEFVPGVTENLHDYLIPTFGDVPPIETRIIEEPDAHGPHGAKGLGEHALIPTAPAILNAIRDASGVRITRVPATPARLRAELRRRQNG